MLYRVYAMMLCITMAGFGECGAQSKKREQWGIKVKNNTSLNLKLETEYRDGRKFVGAKKGVKDSNLVQMIRPGDSTSIIINNDEVKSMTVSAKGSRVGGVQEIYGASGFGRDNRNMIMNQAKQKQGLQQLEIFVEEDMNSTEFDIIAKMG